LQLTVLRWTIRSSCVVSPTTRHRSLVAYTAHSQKYSCVRRFYLHT